MAQPIRPPIATMTIIRNGVLPRDFSMKERGCS